MAAAVAAAPAAGAMPAASAVPQPRSLYAGFWLRFVAMIIDGLILGIPLVFLCVLLAVAFGISTAFGNIHAGEPPDAILAALGLGFVAALILVLIAGSWLYYAGTESSSWQATLGKKALGLYVTDLEGLRISFARASGRFFGKILSGHFTIYIGYIMAGFTAKKQALHDMLASCLVLRRD